MCATRGPLGPFRKPKLLVPFVDRFLIRLRAVLKPPMLLTLRPTMKNSSVPLITSWKSCARPDTTARFSKRSLTTVTDAPG